MILVETELKQSAIHGIGFFAKKFIPKGTKIWEFKEGFDLVFSKEQIDRLSEPARNQVLNYAYISKKTGNYILCTDDSRFFNHDSDANTVCIAPPIANSSESLDCFTKKDIGPGEELTCNYQEFDVDPSDVVNRIE